MGVAIGLIVSCDYRFWPKSADELSAWATMQPMLILITAGRVAAGINWRMLRLAPHEPEAFHGDVSSGQP